MPQLAHLHQQLHLLLITQRLVHKDVLDAFLSRVQLEVLAVAVSRRGDEVLLQLLNLGPADRARVRQIHLPVCSRSGLILWRRARRLLWNRRAERSNHRRSLFTTLCQVRRLRCSSPLRRAVGDHPARLFLRIRTLRQHRRRRRAACWLRRQRPRRAIIILGHGRRLFRLLPKL